MTAAGHVEQSISWMHYTFVFLFISCLKTLLFFGYRSTDFEVHRNWLAITHSLPLHDWYFSAVSEWTLDYPPLFAYFEYILSLCAKLFDPAMLQVDNLMYASTSTIIFQRLSVIVTDVILAFGAYTLTQCFTAQTAAQSLQVFTLCVCNAGLLIIDHIHFQYNGMLLGVLLLCVSAALSERYLISTGLFSMLVLAKHLFVFLAPVVGVYLLFNYCLYSNSTRGFDSSGRVRGHGNISGSGRINPPTLFLVTNFIKLCSVAALFLAVAFGPFVLNFGGDNSGSSSTSHVQFGVKQMTQIFSRLFPFGRGLVHAYWAPNVWAIYCFADKVLYALCSKFALLSASSNSSMSSTSGFNSSGGMVGDFALMILPRITPTMALGLVVISLTPALLLLIATTREQSGEDKEDTHREIVGLANASKQVIHRKQRHFVRALVYASLSSFMFGYHVHEKAIVIPLLLQCFLIYETVEDARLFILLSASGVYGLFPLLFSLRETPVKVLLFSVFITMSWKSLPSASKQDLTLKRLVMGFGCTLYVLFVFTDVVHPWFIMPHLPFVPLMMTSTVCAALNCVCWLLSLFMVMRP